MSRFVKKSLKFFLIIALKLYLISQTVFATQKDNANQCNTKLSSTTSTENSKIKKEQNTPLWQKLARHTYETVIDPYFRPITSQEVPDSIPNRRDRNVLVIGDLDAQWENFYEPLLTAGLIDEELNWTGGNAIVVQLGDVNGLREGFRNKTTNDTAKIWHAMLHLQRQARQHGGAIVPLVGNHELMFIETLLYQAHELMRAQPFSITPDRNYYDEQLYKNGLQIGDTTIPWGINFFANPKDSFWEGRMQIHPLTNKLITPFGEYDSVEDAVGVFEGMRKMWKLVFAIESEGIYFTHAGLTKELVESLAVDGIKRVNERLSFNLDILIETTMNNIRASWDDIEILRVLNSGSKRGGPSPLWDLGVNKNNIAELASKAGIKNLVIGHHHKLMTQHYKGADDKTIKVFYADTTEYPNIRGLFLSPESSRFQLVTTDGLSDNPKHITLHRRAVLEKTTIGWFYTTLNLDKNIPIEEDEK